MNKIKSYNDDLTSKELFPIILLYMPVIEAIGAVYQRLPERVKDLFPIAAGSLTEFVGIVEQEEVREVQVTVFKRDYDPKLHINPNDAFSGFRVLFGRTPSYDYFCRLEARTQIGQPVRYDEYYGSGNLASEEEGRKALTRGLSALERELGL